MRRFSLAVVLVALLTGCATQPATDEPEPSSEETAPDETGTIEATSLLGEPLQRPEPTGERRERLEADLAHAQADLEANPGDEMAIVWVGRRLAYLGRYRDAYTTFTRGIELHPGSYKMHRHAGHRAITLRDFDQAVAHLQRAADLMPETPLETEPDGAPNALNIPLSSTQFNVWYHLALAHYLNGDFEAALEIYERCMETSVNPDLLVATTDWMYMTLRRLGRHEEAAALLDPITADLEIIENDSYHRRLLMYKGEIAPDELLDLRAVDDPDQALAIATQGYGVANWYLVEGDSDRAVEILEAILEGTSWAAFGYIAAEADVARMRGRG